MYGSEKIQSQMDCLLSTTFTPPVQRHSASRWVFRCLNMDMAVS